MRKIKKCDFHGRVKCAPPCNHVFARCRCPIVPTVEIKCIHSGTARELFEDLIFRAASSVEEHPARMVWACKRIAEERHMKVDDVFVEIQNEVKKRTGRSRLPGEALRLKLN